MSESTLSSDFSDFRIAIANFMGLGIDSTVWSATEVSKIAMILKRGLRQFYYPPRLYEGEAPHQWSFLKPIATLDTIATYDTGTIAITLAGTTVTLTTGVCLHGRLLTELWLSMALNTP